MNNFSFNAAMPAAQNNPSQDQSRMLINNMSTASLVNIDHIGFNQNNGGQHKAVTFNQDSNYTPVTFPVVSPQMFTKTVGALPQLHYYSGTQAQSADQYKVDTNFSSLLMGGLIIKCGSITITTDPQTFTYSALTPALSDFPNATLAVFFQQTKPGALASGAAFVVSQTATGFTATGNTATGVPLFFLALGY